MGESKRRSSNFQSSQQISRTLKQNIGYATDKYRRDLFADAEAMFRDVLRESPDQFEANYYLGEIALRQKNYPESVARFERAILSDPSYVAAHVLLGTAFCGLKKYAEGILSYKRALQLAPDNVLISYYLGMAAWEVGSYQEARESYDRVLTIEPGHGPARFNRCMAELKIVYDSEADIDACRSAYEVQLRALCEQGDAAKDGVGVTQPFFLPYQGRDDRELQALYGAYVCSLMQGRYAEAPVPRPPVPGQPIRVGIVSGYFREGHAIWRIPIKGWLTQLDRSRFQVFGYHTGNADDEAAATARKMCDRFVSGEKSVREWRAEILADAPHVLIYPEIGMDGMSGILASLRLAPVQCNVLGHPETSGYPTIDYYLSSELMETEDAQQYYTEQLVRLPNLAVFLEPIAQRAGAITRNELGIGDDVPAFWCGQSFFKFLPQYDSLYAKVALATGPCKFLFVQHTKRIYATEAFRQRLRQAFAAVGLNADEYCVFLPELEQLQFIAATGLCDVYLDSAGWAGFNSALEAIAFDLPIVTFPLDRLRSRHSVALLKRMGIEETIATSADDYVAIASRLARDPTWRAKIKASVARSKHKIYEDVESVKGLERFMQDAVAGYAAREPGRLPSVEGAPAQ
jgi:protein O-GlcNAc transferase